VPRWHLALAGWGVNMLENHEAGNWTSQSLFVRLDQSTSMAEVGTAIAAAILPAHSMAGVHSPYPGIAIPHAVGRRGRLVADRIRQRLRPASPG
jgi:hypothetical protein